MQVLLKALSLTLASAMAAVCLNMFTLQHLQHLDLVISWQVGRFIVSLPLILWREQSSRSKPFAG
jgi:hypothetical protein